MQIHMLHQSSSCPASLSLTIKNTNVKGILIGKSTNFAYTEKISIARRDRFSQDNPIVSVDLEKLSFLNDLKRGQSNYLQGSDTGVDSKIGFNLFIDLGSMIIADDATLDIQITTAGSLGLFVGYISEEDAVENPLHYQVLGGTNETIPNCEEAYLMPVGTGVLSFADTAIIEVKNSLGQSTVAPVGGLVSACASLNDAKVFPDGMKLAPLYASDDNIPDSVQIISSAAAGTHQILAIMNPVNAGRVSLSQIKSTNHRINKVKQIESIDKTKAKALRRSGRIISSQDMVKIGNSLNMGV